jgi:predicted alpha/beta-hydrolase family hydrolase
MKTKIVSIPIKPGENVSGVVGIPEAYRTDESTGIILAHGAGNDMNNPLIVFLSTGLAEIGYLILRFNFPYKEKGRKAPDPENVLVRTWQSTYEFLSGHTDYAPRKIMAAGKSMGCRIALQMVAEGQLPTQGLIFLGYPLHRPGDKERLRVAHLYQVSVPLLFFAGTRDSLCDVSLLKGILQQLSVPWALKVIEGGDHSFQVPKSSEVSQEEIYRRIFRKTVQWLQSL